MNILKKWRENRAKNRRAEEMKLEVIRRATAHDYDYFFRSEDGRISGAILINDDKYNLMEYGEYWGKPVAEAHKARKEQLKAQLKDVHAVLEGLVATSNEDMEKRMEKLKAMLARNDEEELIREVGITKLLPVGKDFEGVIESIKGD